MNWFTLAITSALALAVAELTQQYLLNKKGGFSEKSSGVITFFLQAIAVLPIIFLTGRATQLPSILSPDILPLYLLAGFLATVAMTFYLKSFTVKNISLSSIFISGSVVVSTFFGIRFLGEEITTAKIIGTLLVLGAVIAVNYKNLEIELNNYYGLLAGILFGIVYTIDKKIVITTDPLIYLFWAFSAIAVLGTIFNFKHVKKEVLGAKFADYKAITISSAMYLIFNLCTFYAYNAGGDVGKIDAINNAQIFIIIIAEYFILKKTKGIKRKIISATVAFIGIYLLGNY